MQPVSLTSYGGNAALLLDTNTTNNTESSFNASDAAVTSVTGGVVLDVKDPGFLWLMLFGTDAENETLTAIIKAAKNMGGTSYTPGGTIAYMLATLGSAPTGVDGVTPNGSSDLFCDTIDNTGGHNSVTILNDHSGNKGAAMARVDCSTCEKVYAQLLIGTAASANGIYWWGN